MYTDVVKVGRAVFADQLSPTNCSHYTHKKKRKNTYVDVTHTPETVRVSFESAEGCESAFTQRRSTFLVETPGLPARYGRSKRVQYKHVHDEKHRGTYTNSLQQQGVRTYHPKNTTRTAKSTPHHN